MRVRSGGVVGVVRWAVCDVSVVGGPARRERRQAFIAVRGNKGMKGAEHGGNASRAGSVKRVKKVGRRRGGGARNPYKYGPRSCCWEITAASCR